MKHFVLIVIIVVALTAGYFYSVDTITKNKSAEEQKKDFVIPDMPTSGTKSSDELATAQSAAQNQSTNQSQTMNIDLQKTYVAVLRTSEGDIAIELDTKNTPKTASNFITLAAKGFYSNTIFHRVIKDFMIQGGDPKGDGTGGPGFTFPDEPFTGDYTRGTVAMANAGPNTNGSQFFIMHADKPLPKNYVIFGHVLKGMETVDLIAGAEVEAGPSGEESKPVTPVVVQKVEIMEKQVQQ